MAIRDRIIVIVKEGQAIEVVATKVGSSVDYKTSKDWLEVWAESENRTRFKFAQIAVSEVVYFVRDQQPLPTKTKVRVSKEK